jgi:ATP-binding protein involved in chromosome partitioning
MPVFGGTPQNPFDTQQPIPGVKNVIAVGAGKGGVGKSTVASNLALTLSQMGKKVGLLDSDIYGPSIPHIMGLQDAKPNLTAQNKIDPVVKFGIKIMSLGFLVEENAAVIWRGPMLFKAITQFLHDVNWGELDFLIVDLPPGTGDVQLTLAQKTPLSGAVIVSTPQDMSLIDVTRCVDMFNKVKTPILGLVENMSGYICSHCGEENELFKPGKLHQYCEENKIPLLGQIPFEPQVGWGSENGAPLMSIDKASSENSGQASRHAFEKIAKALIQE